jgi:hypothetical protein
MCQYEDIIGNPLEIQPNRPLWEPEDALAEREILERLVCLDKNLHHSVQTIIENQERIIEGLIILLNYNNPHIQYTR